MGTRGLHVCWQFKDSVELCLVANLDSAQAIQIPRPVGEIIFEQSTHADEGADTMQVRPS
jgi:hypothetical protein